MKAVAAPSDLLRGFSPPPELVRSAPRDVRLTSGGMTLTVIAWLLAIAAVPVATLLYREAQRQAAAATALDRGLTAPAVVDRLWQKKSDGKPVYAAIHFDAGGTRIEGERRMNTQAWKQLQVGSTVTVRYLPDNPRTWTMPGARGNTPLPSGVSFLIAGLMGGLALLLSAVVRWQRSLLTDGRVAPAVVTSFRSHKSSHGAHHRVIRYEFPLLGGGIEKGKASVSTSAAVGDRICVIYDPERPKRSRPYPLSLVTPDMNR